MKFPPEFATLKAGTTQNLGDCVIVQLHRTLDGLNLLNGNLYFRPDTKPEMTTNYFRFVENELDT